METNLILGTLRPGEHFKFTKGYNFNNNAPVDRGKIYYSRGHFSLLGYTLISELHSSRKASIKIYGTAIVNLI